MTILDVHHHIGSLGIGSSDHATTAGADTDDYESRTTLMDKFGITCAAIMPSLQYDRTDGIRNTRAVNDGIADYRDRHAMRFPIACGTVEPLYDKQTAIAEIQRMARELRFKGIVWHNRFQGTFLDDRRMDPLVDAATAEGLVVLVHVFADSKLEAPWTLEALADRHREARFIALDAFTGSGESEAMIALARRNPNIWFETAGAFGLGRVLERFIDGVGAGRLVFGSDLYASPPWWRVPQPLVELQASPLAEDGGLDGVLGGNAAGLFGITLTAGLAASGPPGGSSC